jgi:hypothetical protein
MSGTLPLRGASVAQAPSAKGSRGGVRSLRHGELSLIQPAGPDVARRGCGCARWSGWSICPLRPWPFPSPFPTAAFSKDLQSELVAFDSNNDGKLQVSELERIANSIAHNRTKLKFWRLAIILGKSHYALRNPP